MEPTFNEAATGTGKLSGTTITSDWDGTLFGLDFYNCTLLEDLSDARREGARVIITSSVGPARIEQNFGLLVKLARGRGYDVLDGTDFEQISKSDLKKMGLESDYSFDNDPIKTQPLCNYVSTAMEIRIEQDYCRSPMNRTVFRAMLGLSPKPEFGLSAGVQPECSPR